MSCGATNVRSPEKPASASRVHARSLFEKTEDGRTVTKDVGGATPGLTPTEWLILDQLLRNPRRLVTRDSLLTAVWGPASNSSSPTLKVSAPETTK